MWPLPKPQPPLAAGRTPALRDLHCRPTGLGVGLVLDYVVQDAVTSGEVLTTLDEWRLSIFGTQMFMLYMPDRHQTRAVRTCIDYLLGRALPTQA